MDAPRVSMTMRARATPASATAARRAHAGRVIITTHHLQHHRCIRECIRPAPDAFARRRATAARASSAPSAPVPSLDWRPTLTAEELVASAAVAGFASVAWVALAFGRLYYFRERAHADAAVSYRAAADASSRFTRVGDVDVHFKRVKYVRGAPKRVVECMHGFGANVSSWTVRDTMVALSEALEADVAAHDSAGFGLTERVRDVGKYTRASDAKVCAAIIEQMKSDASSSSSLETVLVGHSLGAVGAALACSNDIGASRVVLVAPAIIAGKTRSPKGRLPITIRVVLACITATATAATWCLTYAMKPFVVFVLRQLVRNKQFWINGLSAAIDKSRVASMPVNWVDGYRQPSIVRGWEDGMFRVVLAAVAAVNSPAEIFRAALAAARRDLDDQAADDEEEDAIQAIVKSGVKVLIVHGENDAIVPVTNSLALVDRIPNARLEIVPRCGHMPHEESPQDFIRIVQSFCNDAT
jgi:pimeloyl-ACP methyl ester carboxylesterase